MRMLSPAFVVALAAAVVLPPDASAETPERVLIACEACGGEPGAEEDEDEGEEEAPEAPEDDEVEPGTDHEACEDFEEVGIGESPTAIVYFEDERVPGRPLHVLSCMGFIEKLCVGDRVLLCGPDGMDDFMAGRPQRLTLVARATDALTLRVGTAIHPLVPTCPPDAAAPCDAFEVRVPLDVVDERDRFMVNAIHKEGVFFLEVELQRKGTLVARAELNVTGFEKPHALAPYRADTDAEDPKAALVLVQDTLHGALPLHTDAAIERIPHAVSLDWDDGFPPVRCEPASNRPGVFVLAAPVPGPALRLEDRFSGQTSDPERLPALAKGTTCPSTVSLDIDPSWVVHAYADLIAARLARADAIDAPPVRPLAPDAFVPFGLKDLTVAALLAHLGGDRGALAKLLAQRLPGIGVRADAGRIAGVTLRTGIRFEDLRALGLDPLLAAFVDAPVEHLLAVLGTPTRRNTSSASGIETVVYEAELPRRPMLLRVTATRGRVTALNFEMPAP
jgi:hypothetical protein